VHGDPRLPRPPQLQTSIPVSVRTPALDVSTQLPDDRFLPKPCTLHPTSYTLYPTLLTLLQILTLIICNPVLKPPTLDLKPLNA